MIKSITMAPLMIEDACLWFNDFCSNLHPVKFLCDRGLLYVDARLYDRVSTGLTAPPKLEQLMNEEDYGRFAGRLFCMRDGDFICGRCTLLLAPNDNKMMYVLSRGMVGEAAAVTGVFYDVSLIESLRNQLISMDNLITLGQLSAGILHDMGNQIMTAGAMASVIRDMTDDPRIKQYAGDIVQCMDACGQLANNSKGIAKSSIDKFTRINIWNMMLRITNMLKGTFKDKYNISIKTYSEYYYVLGDEYLLQNAILNLLLNARDAMPGGGNITIRISNNEDILVISIRDTGVGMDDSIKSRIFEPFFTTKSGLGTGIGLTRCKSTIECHNGAIDVNSAPGKGSEFIIKLPLLR